RAYVYGAMRVTGAADPTVPVKDTLPGKLPQRKIVTTAAAGYSSYGNQIGLATGIVDEIYHPGYAAKRMEIGAVIAAVPAENVRRERPAPGDAVILLGGATGRDGCGGATGSSKSHTAHSLETCGAEVQKGNAPEERKLQRLFRNKDASLMIKRCNDFGAGGVSVAVGELADGLEIDLDKVVKKYEGLDGTELAISESQERMAVVVAEKDVEAFLDLARKENLRADRIASVTDKERLVMKWRGRVIVDLSRDFMSSNGAPKHIKVKVAKPLPFDAHASESFTEGMKALVQDLNVCSKKGLSERFDSTIGAGTVLMPFGGASQSTPIQAMAHKIPSETKHTDDCSVMSWGFEPYISEKSPYHGAYIAVVESVSKLIASGAPFEEVYLSFQEYFERPGKDPSRWGKPFAALLGAFRAQTELGVGAIGGKDSMSGSFEKLDVPPTLVSFAVTHTDSDRIISPEFKRAGSKVYILRPEIGADSLPTADSLKALFEKVSSLTRSGLVRAAYTPGFGGIAEAVFKMCLGNGFGFTYDNSAKDVFSSAPGSFILEADSIPGAETLGEITSDPVISFGGEKIALAGLIPLYESKLESVYPCRAEASGVPETFTYPDQPFAAPTVRCARPRVLIPAFPGTNCEYDSAKAFEDAGAETKIFVINNLDGEGISASVAGFAEELDRSQIVFIPGGFSGGDEPDGSGKFITAFFRSDAVKNSVTDLLDRRGGLMLGICNGFQALIKLGLVPFGKILDAEPYFPTLTFNTIARHQSKIVRTRVSSNLSPWLKNTRPGDVFSVPISHGEGRFIASESMIRSLAEKGQIATQYVDPLGAASNEVEFNPNGSMFAVEGITSPDGRVLGKMGHSERKGSNLYKNVPGNYEIALFDSAVRFFKG
ncbi:MAG: phosphoribosylformylglycinamidine synthase, partial [Clostridia bacterium]|nr:phosphoribosylformylglycinamidine synthase [Clostridia bacterium]